MSTRPKTGPRITQRDQMILWTLHRYQLVREATLHSLHFPEVRHQRTVQATLKRLSDVGYIGRRFLPPIHRLNDSFIDYSRQDRSGAVYFLDRPGAAHLGTDYNPAAAKVKINYLHHRLDIADIRACFDLVLRSPKGEGGAKGGITLAHWFDENQKDEDDKFILHDQVIVEDPKTGDKRRLPIRPDACLILEERPTGPAVETPSLPSVASAKEGGVSHRASPPQEFFFLEIDEGTESGKKRWRDKVTAYRQYSRHGFAERYHFNGHGFRVLTITRTPSGTHQDKRATTLLENTLAAGGRKQFWFTTFAQVMPHGRPTLPSEALRSLGEGGAKEGGSTILSSPIWQRAASPDQCPHLALSDYLFGRDRP